MATALVAAQVLVRSYWATGGRWKYACVGDSVELSAGCGVADLTRLRFWHGWGAVAVCAGFALVAVLALVRRSTVASASAWVACVASIVLSFPMHLVFEIPAGIAGRPTDWQDIAGRLLLLAGGLALGAAAAAPGRRGSATVPAPAPIPAWLRGWAIAGVVIPALGWALPHGLWMLGVPFGIPGEEIDEIRRDITPMTAAAITFVPALASLLTLGLAQRWGRVFPAWMPWLGGRRVPPPLALIPAGTVAVALVAYGVIGVGIITRDLSTGELTAAELAEGWAAAATVLVFLAWGVSLGVAAYGYHRTTRHRPGRAGAGRRLSRGWGDGGEVEGGVEGDGRLAGR